MTRMPAPYPGKCAECGWPIAAGEEIDADDDSPPAHARCVDDADETADEGWWEQ